jgi:hypothetical protein
MGDDMTRDSYIGVGLLAFSVLFWVEANRIPTSFLDTSVPASAIPKMLGVMMGVLSLILIVQGILARKKAPSAEPDEEADGVATSWHGHQRALGMFVIGVCYLVVVSYLGYIVSTALLLAAVAYFNGKKSALPLILFAGLGAVFFYAMFTLGLGVQMPGGLLPTL